MNYLFLLVAVAVSATAAAAGKLSAQTPLIVSYSDSSTESFEGSDRTITWHAWKEVPGAEFNVRTGDRYLGGQKWEHYLAFERHRASVKAIKLFMIRLGAEDVREEVVIRAGLRYAILKVTNNTMTARKGVWSWTAQEVYKGRLARED
jgi:hypothetical protein